MVDFVLRNRGQIVQHTDVNQYALAFNGNTPFRLLLTQHDDDTDYTAIIGNVDTTNGNALKVQYGIAGAPTTILTATKAQVGVQKPLRVSGDGSFASARGFLVTSNNQVLLFEAAVADPDDEPDTNTNLQIVKTLTGGSNILVDSTAYVAHAGDLLVLGDNLTSGVATGVLTGATTGPPGTATMTGAGWTNGDLAGRIIIATNGVLTGYGLIANNTPTVITLNDAWAGTVPALDWTFRLVSKGDPSNLKINTYVMSGSAADVRSIEAHIESSANRGEATQWLFQGGVHPGVATTDGTDKVVCYVAQVTPPSENPGKGIVAPATAVSGDVAFLAIGGAVDGVAGSAGWRRYIRFRDSSDNISFEVLGDGQVNLPKLSSATEPSTGLTGLYTLAANSRLYRFPNGGSQTQIADQLTSYTLLGQASGTGASSVISITGIPATYRSLVIHISGRTDAATTATAIRLTFEASPTVGAYFHQLLRGNNVTTSASQNAGSSDFLGIASAPGASSTASLYGMAIVTIPEYANTSMKKNVISQTAAASNLATGELYIDNVSGFWNATTAISAIYLTLASGNWTAASRVSVFGAPAA